MRKPMMAGNWKMNKTINEAVDLARPFASRSTRSTTSIVSSVRPSSISPWSALS